MKKVLIDILFFNPDDLHLLFWARYNEINFSLWTAFLAIKKVERKIWPFETEWFSLQDLHKRFMEFLIRGGRREKL